MSKLELLKNSIAQKRAFYAHLPLQEEKLFVCMTLLESDKTRDGRDYACLVSVSFEPPDHILFAHPIFVPLEEIEDISLIRPQPELFLEPIQNELPKIVESLHLLKP